MQSQCQLKRKCYRKRTLARLVLVCYYSHASYMTANSRVLVNFQTFLVGGISPSNWPTGPEHKPVWRNGIRACLKNKSICRVRFSSCFIDDLSNTATLL